MCRMAHRIYKGRWEDQNKGDYSLISEWLPPRALSCPLPLESKTEAGEINPFSRNKFYVEEGTSSLHIERHLGIFHQLSASQQVRMSLWDASSLTFVLLMAASYTQTVPDSVSWLWGPLTEVLYIPLWMMQRSRVLACYPLTGFHKH